jgi:hypothetical protein
LASGEVKTDEDAARVKGEIEGAFTDLVKLETQEQNLLYGDTA